MGSESTRRLIAKGDSARHLAKAIGARRRLQEEAIKLHRQRLDIERRLAEIDAEEEIMSKAIDEAAAEISAALTGAEAKGESDAVREGVQEEG